MEDSKPARSVFPKVSIPVEESRAQRLQRSQARFRDRGGIFVPTSRNTLADILLGRKVASPKKKRGRSASLSPKKKSVESNARNNDDEIKAVRMSPRKAIQKQELKAGPSNVHEHKTAKKSAKKVVAPATITSKAKVKEDDEKPTTKKRVRKPKATVQDVESSADASADHDPPPLEKSQSTTKKSRTQKVSKKATKLEASKGDSPAEHSPKPRRSTKAASKTPSDEVPAEDDANVKKSSRASTSKKHTTSKRKSAASVDHEPEPAPLQQLSTSAGLSKSEKHSPEDDRQPNEVHSKESVNVKRKARGKALQATDRGDKPGLTAVEVPPKLRKRRARPVESEMECPSPSKRVKQIFSEEAKSDRRKAPTTRKENEKNVSTKSKDVLSKSPPSKKRAREPDEDQMGAKRKKTKGVVDADPLPDGAVDKQGKSKEINKRSKKAEKIKKPPASKASRMKKSTSTTKISNQDKVGTI
ncbi:hypothetical protein H2248_004834 [Termitomyces sp. 'cryptogamus']|nr:hypothetical protein H2248_004834 [Termitomyces sp. 'cryptogamus']